MIHKWTWKTYRSMVVALALIISSSFFAPSVSSDLLVSEIADRAGKLRAAGIIDARRLNQYFGGPEQVIDLSMPGVSDREIRALWSYFFAHSQVYVGLGAGNSPVVGYYNAIVDYWFFTQWDRASADGNTTPYVNRMWTLPGNLLIAPEASGTDALKPEPPWIRAAATVPYTTTISLFAGETVKAFLDTYPMSSKAPFAPVHIEFTDDDLRRLLRDRLSAMLSTVIALQASDDLAPYHESVMKAVANADIASLEDLMTGYEPPVPLDVIVSMKQELRTGLIPAMLLDLGDEKIIISGREDNGSWFFVSHYADQGGFARLKALTYLSVLPVNDESFAEENKP